MAEKIRSNKILGTLYKLILLFSCWSEIIIIIANICKKFWNFQKQL